MALEGMYRPRHTPREKVSAEIATDLRQYSIDAQHIAHAFAALHGLHGTDLQALVAVMDAERIGEPLTAGRLGEHLNLSSGSVTALVDRLERAGHLRRERDTVDRRKVYLRYAEQGAALAVNFFRPLGVRTDEVLDQFSDAELEVVHRFLAAMVRSMSHHRDEVRAARPENGRARRQ